MDLKALTLHRPWPSAIFYSQLDDSVAPKRIENRCWRIPGSDLDRWVGVHAGQTFDSAAATKVRNTTGWKFPLKRNRHPEGIVGVVKFTNVHLSLSTVPEAQKRWFSGPYGWEMGASIWLPEPVPCRGWQGLWRVPIPDIAAIAEQLQANGSGLALSALAQIEETHHA